MFPKRLGSVLSYPSETRLSKNLVERRAPYSSIGRACLRGLRLDVLGTSAGRLPDFLDLSAEHPSPFRPFPLPVLRSLDEDAASVVFPFMDLPVPINPTAGFQRGDECVLGARPFSHVGYFCGGKRGQIARRRIVQGPPPEKMQMADSLSPVDSQLASQPAQLQMSSERLV